MCIISPSILSADLLSLERDLKEVEQGGADWHHIDVMDGHFVPNLSFGLPLVASIKKVSTLPLDVHLMISNPEQMIPDYIRAGADLISFHVEAAVHAHRSIQLIKENGLKAGLAINPGTPMAWLDPLLTEVDMVLVMSVNPGFGGQTFIPASYKRIAELAAKLKQIGRNSDVFIQVDGGINHENIGKAYRSGANAFVAGSSIYGVAGRGAAIKRLRDHAKRGAIA